MGWAGGILRIVSTSIKWPQIGRTCRQRIFYSKNCAIFATLIMACKGSLGSLTSLHAAHGLRFLSTVSPASHTVEGGPRSSVFEYQRSLYMSNPAVDLDDLESLYLNECCSISPCIIQFYKSVAVLHGRESVSTKEYC